MISLVEFGELVGLFKIDKLYKMIVDNSNACDKFIDSWDDIVFVENNEILQDVKEDMLLENPRKIQYSSKTEAFEKQLSTMLSQVKDEDCAFSPEKEKLEKLNEKFNEMSNFDANKTATNTEGTDDMFVELCKIQRDIEIKEVISLYQSAERVNVLFLVDSTHSMTNHLTGVKNQIFDIARKLKRCHPDISLNVSFIAYRDFGCEPRFEVFPFSTDIAAFEDFVRNIRPISSRDTAEDVLGGLDLALNQDWTVNNSASRVLIHIGDAPCHGKLYHALANDDFPHGDPYGLYPPSIMARMKAMKIEYIFGRINQSTDIMIHLFDQYAGGGFISVTDVSDPTFLAKSTVDSISQSINKTASKLIQGKEILSKTNSCPRQKTYRIVTAMPEWSRIPIQTAVMYTNNKIRSINQLLPISSTLSNLLHFGIAQSTDGIQQDNLQVKIAPQPFAEGASRVSRYAQVYYLKKWLSAVFKEFKYVGRKAHSIDAYLNHVEVSAMADYLASEYNKIRAPGHEEVFFLRSHVVETCPVRTFSLFGAPAHTRYYAMEMILPSELPFTKYTNNMGYVNADAIDKSLSRFSRWTYEVTNGYLMVVDLQGVHSKDGFILTDPVILCEDGCRFGKTNLGRSAMLRCNASLSAFL